MPHLLPISARPDAVVLDPRRLGLERYGEIASFIRLRSGINPGQLT